MGICLRGMGEKRKSAARTDKTTKVGAGTEQVDMETVHPYGHEEIAAQIAAEAKGDAKVPPVLDPTQVEPTPKERKPLEPDQPRNPRRQRNSRPD